MWGLGGWLILPTRKYLLLAGQVLAKKVDILTILKWLRVIFAGQSAVSRQIQSILFFHNVHLNYCHLLYLIIMYWFLVLSTTLPNFL